MPQATVIDITTRRKASRAGLDAALIGHCAEAMRLDRLAEADDLDAADRALDAWSEVADVIAATPARTAEGMRAKAAIIHHLMAPMQPRWAEGDTEDRAIHDPLVWSLVRDLAAAAG